MELFGTSKINQKNHLEIGGCDTVELANQYGTPLFVYDVALIKAKARGFKKTFEDLDMKHRVVYASKAFTSLALYKLLAAEGLAFDVVSGGELHAALKAGVSPEMIEFHGNNKSAEELAMAVNVGIGTIVVDNFYEIELLKSILKETGKQQKILLRVSPGVDAHTHSYILTGQEDSKFGFDVKSGQAEQALQLVLADQGFDVIGIHCHIGSQIFGTEGFEAATEKMMAILLDWQSRFNFVASVLNLGGGFGVKYSDEDTPLEAPEYVKQIATMVKVSSQAAAYPLPEVWIEPGRSIVAEAGTTLYTVGSRKSVPNVRNFVSVDGGMGDNIRPALYDATYSAVVANRMTAPAEEVVTVTGKYCESGDKLITDIQLPILAATDILAIVTTGAYGYSMASVYNKNPRPAVVFVENGESQLVLRRETYDDLINLDVIN
ncbi:diaminopimelate decarboxylase [Vagococcus sp. BWB3-3]|uniref:Diaminopimelate decarboxylase n=1 Tax=Vagococcus allomyrinae TaxID=2794353 RepID=A0A940P370_9ENTE|nr:diaminopimelate decarboxylase [Vagococcus allomyrinae]MBP1040669.1 diaminopimelate decarboxylase [Vagococcus allomyrinae]